MCLEELTTAKESYSEDFILISCPVIFLLEKTNFFSSFR
jgi:hypothetical protein